MKLTVIAVIITQCLVTINGEKLNYVCLLFLGYSYLLSIFF